MATPPNDDSKTLFRLLADRQWHPYVEIRDAIAATVPPGRALRKYQERVDYKRKYLNDPTYDTDASEDERIYYGARACGQIVITSWKGRGLDFTGMDENKKIRLKPGFKTWGIEQMPPDPVEPEVGEVAQEPAEAVQDGRAVWEKVLDDSDRLEAEYLAGLEEDRVQAIEEDKRRTAGAHRAAEEPVSAPPAPSPPVSVEGLDYCESCGAWVQNQVLHDAWHLAVSEAKSRDDMALFSESDVRRLIEEVVAKQLDLFQVGMQRYLGTQFAQLESTMAAVAGLPWRAQKHPIP